MINSIMVKVGDTIKVHKSYEHIDNSHQFIVTHKGEYRDGKEFIEVIDSTNELKVILDNYDEDEDFTVLEKGAWGYTEEKRPDELFKTQLKF
jgi:hypothetical protein